MYLKVHSIQGQKIVAACDKELIGKIISGRKARLDLARFASFYKGATASEAQVISAIASASSVNLVGKKAVALAIKAGVASKSEIIKLGRVPHLQLYRI